jgi:hypothetical protein
MTLDRLQARLLSLEQQLIEQRIREEQARDAYRAAAAGVQQLLGACAVVRELIASEPGDGVA